MPYYRIAGNFQRELNFVIFDFDHEIKTHEIFNRVYHVYVRGIRVTKLK